MNTINKIITENLLKEKNDNDNRSRESNTIKVLLGIIALAIIVIFLRELKTIFIEGKKNFFQTLKSAVFSLKVLKNNPPPEYSDFSE